MESANYYHNRMMEARKEPLDSEFRVYRHKLIARARGNYQNLKNALRTLLEKNYGVKQGETEASMAASRFFIQSRQRSRQDSRSSDSQKRSATALTSTRPRGLVDQEKLLSVDPVDLSLSNVPSLECVDQDKPYQRKPIPKCPELITYINKRANVKYYNLHRAITRN